MSIKREMKSKIENLLSYSTASFKQDGLQSERFGKAANDSDVMQTIKSKRSSLEDNSKETMKSTLNNVTQSLDSPLKKPSGTSYNGSKIMTKKNSKENVSLFVYDEKSTSGPKSVRESFSLNSSLKRKTNNDNNGNVKNKLLKEIAHFKNTLNNDLPSSSNRQTAFSSIKVSTNEYFDFSPTKVRQKCLVNATYLQNLREKQQAVDNTNDCFFTRNSNRFRKPEKENSLEAFKKDFKNDDQNRDKYAKKSNINNKTFLMN